jgi:peptidyl-prolyl cis-trans isomerase SurA
MKNIYQFVILLLGVLLAPVINAQKADPVLFTVEGKPVHLSEFNYIYNKNNGEKADYSKESVMEYLDLYQKFKLKVQKAKDMQLDTVPALINELAGYRRQLADSYLTDKEVTENLIKEVY